MISGLPDGKRGSQEVSAALLRGSLGDQQGEQQENDPAQQLSAGAVAGSRSRSRSGQPRSATRRGPSAGGQAQRAVSPPALSFSKQRVPGLSSTVSLALGSVGGSGAGDGQREPVRSSSLASALGSGGGRGVHRPGLRGASSYDGTASIQISVALEVRRTAAGHIGAEVAMLECLRLKLARCCRSQSES